MFRPGTKRARIMEAQIAGVPRDQIADAFGNYMRTTFSAARQLGADIPKLTSRPRRPNLPTSNGAVVRGAARDELRNLVRTLIESGLSHRHTAREVGISLGLTQRLLHSRSLAGR